MLHHRAFVVTVFWTLALLLLGSVVHATESSLACPDWPTCFGTMVPEMTGGVFWEHLHRLVAGGLFLMFGLATWLAYKETAERPWIFRASLVGLGLLLVQSLLGGITVIYRLPDAVSTSHLGLAFLFLTLATVLASATGGRGGESRRAGARAAVAPGTPSDAPVGDAPVADAPGAAAPGAEAPHAAAPGAAAPDADAPAAEPPGAEAPGADAFSTSHALRFRNAAIGAAALVFVQSVLGGVVRHTEAGLACPDVPLCLGRWVPPLVSGPVALHFSHRVLGLAVALVVVGLVGWAYRYGAPPLLRAWAAVAALLVLLQVGLGFASVLTLLAAAPVSLHTLVAASLLATLAHLAVRAHARAATPPGRRTRPEAPAALAGR